MLFVRTQNRKISSSEANILGSSIMSELRNNPPEICGKNVSKKVKWIWCSIIQRKPSSRAPMNSPSASTSWWTSDLIPNGDGIRLYGWNSWDIRCGLQLMKDLIFHRFCLMPVSSMQKLQISNMAPKMAPTAKNIGWSWSICSLAAVTES